VTHPLPGCTMGKCE